LAALVLLAASSFVLVARTTTTAQAALGGLTLFNIDGDTAGPNDWDAPYAGLMPIFPLAPGGSGVTEPCIVPSDPDQLDGKLNKTGNNPAFDPETATATPGNVVNKGDLCKAYVAYEVKAMPDGTYHTILYGAWQRAAGQGGQISFYVPLIGPISGRDDDTLVKYDYDPSDNSVKVSLMEWNGTDAWVPKAINPAAFEAAVENAAQASFGEFAVDLSDPTVGVLPPGECGLVRAPFVFTETGQAQGGTPELQDYVNTTDLNLTNCSNIKVTKHTSPADPPTTTFNYTVSQADGGPLDNAGNTQYNSSLTVPPNDASNTHPSVIGSPDYLLSEATPPAPWQKQSIVCQAYNPAVIDPVTGGATLQTFTITNGGSFPVAPLSTIKGATATTIGADCVITNAAASLTLVKQVDNRTGGSAQPGDWTLRAAPQGTTNYVINGAPTVADPSAPVDQPRASISALVQAGTTFDLSETGGPGAATYTNGTTWACVKGDGSAATQPTPQRVTVSSGTDDITCTIVNTAKAPKLSLVKVVDNTLGGSADPTDFTVTAARVGGGALAGTPATFTGTTVMTGVAVPSTATQTGTFNLSETTQPSYLASWACVNNAAGTSFTYAPGSTQVTFGPGADVTCTVTNTFNNFTATISGSSRNPVGTPHVFTVTAFKNGAPLQGALVDVAVTGTADWSTTCETAPGTAADGTCTVTVNKASPGVATVQVLGFLELGPNSGSSGALSFNGDGPSATKTWVAVNVTVTPSSTNFAGENHTFTITASLNDGSGTPQPVPDGTVISYSWSGAGTANPASSCTTDNNQCNVTVSSANPGVGTLTITSVTITLTKDSGTLPPTLQTYVLDGSAPGTVTFPAPVTKTWINYTVTVTPNAENLLPGDPSHTFTVSLAVQPAGAAPVAGQTLSLDAAQSVPGTITSVTGLSSGSFENADAECVTDQAGQCHVTITVQGPNTLTLSASYSAAKDTGVVHTFTGSATKKWVTYAVTVTPTAVDLVGHPHTFTVALKKDSGDGNGFQPLPNTGPVNLTLVNAGGANATLGSPTCTTNASGLCLVTITSTTAGTSSLTASFLGTSADSAPQTFTSNTAVKTWINYVLDITPNTAENVLEAEPAHTFDLTLTGQSPDPALVPVGSQPIAVTLTGTGATIAGAGSTGTVTDNTGTTATCTTDAAGHCSVVVTATQPTTVTLAGTFSLAETVEIGGTPASFTDSATKAWVSYRVTVTPETATNLVDTDHNMTVLVEKDSGNGQGFQPLAGAQNVQLTIVSGPGAIISVDGVAQAGATTSTTCTTNASGECHLVIRSLSPGLTTLHASYVGTAADSASFTYSDQATKAWINYAIALSGQAVNLLPTDPFHTFEVTLTSQGPAGQEPSVAGKILQLELNQPGTDATYTGGVSNINGNFATCTTDANGKCFVTIHSSTPVTVTLNASFTVTVSGVTRTFDAQSTKTYITYDVSVTPETDINLINTNHTFTVTLKRDLGDGLGLQNYPSPQAPNDSFVTVTLTGPGSIVSVNGSAPDSATSSKCAIGPTATCTVVTTSSVVGASSLQATYMGLAADTADKAPFTDTGNKTWIDYLLTVTPDTAINLLPGFNSHTFTVTLTSTPDSTSAPIAGQTIQLALSSTNGLASISGGATSCVTDGNGQCQVVVTTTGPDVATLTATFTTSQAVGEARAFSDSGIKTWITYQISLTPETAENILPQDPSHTLTVTLTSQPNGTAAPIAGQTINLSVTSNNSTVFTSTNGTTATCLTNSSGVCTVDITASAAGSSTITASYGAVNGQQTATFTDTATKTWVLDADLAITKTVVPTEVVVGEQQPVPTVTYTLVVENLGPSNAVNAKVVDTVPAQLSDVVVTNVVSSANDDPNLYTCGAVTSGTLTCTNPLHVVGVTYTITITAKVTPDLANVPPSIVNVATVSSDTPDSDLTNNSDDATVTPQLVSATIDLAIVKTPSTSTVVPGQAFSYTLNVSNAGPDDATQVVVTDNVPSTLTVTSVTSSDFTCSHVGNAVTCTRPTLVSGASGTITVNVTAKSTGLTNGQVISNTGVVAGHEEETNLDNNSSTTPVSVVIAILPPTGADPSRALEMACVALLSGFLLVLITRRREPAKVRVDS